MKAITSRGECQIVSLVQNVIFITLLFPPNITYETIHFSNLLKNAETTFIFQTRPLDYRAELSYRRCCRLMKSSGISLINCLKGKKRFNTLFCQSKKHQWYGQISWHHQNCTPSYPILLVYFGLSYDNDL